MRMSVWPHCAASLLCLGCEGVGFPESELDCYPDVSLYRWGTFWGLWISCASLSKLSLEIDSR